MTLQLDDEEKEILARALKIYLSDLREEIYKTESHETKPPLKREEVVVKSILERLEKTAVL